MNGQLRAYRPARKGQSLLELIAATTIIATALVPALRMMRDSLRVSRDIETAGMMTSLCVSKLEQEIARSAATWELQPASGDFRSEGRPDLRFAVWRSDESADGGIKNALMAISVVVWHDRNGNAVLDQGEPTVRYGTKLSKTLGFQDEAK